jgi:hypothetical protein
VREVYAIHSWQPAGTAAYRTRTPQDVKLPGRWEFDGSLADKAIRDRYVGKSVAQYFKKGMQSPVVYVNA